MIDVHPNRTKSVTRQRYYQNQYLHSGDPVREIWSVILEVVQLLPHVQFLRDAFPKRSSETRRIILKWSALSSLYINVFTIISIFGETCFRWEIITRYYYTHKISKHVKKNITRHHFKNITKIAIAQGYSKWLFERKLGQFFFRSTYSE